MGVPPTARGLGGRYDPVMDTWQTTSLLNAPEPRRYTTAIWAAGRMVVWGGTNTAGDGVLRTGGRYDPLADSWTPTSMTGAPSARGFHTAIWTGSLLVVWGGYVYSPPAEFATGGRYDPAADTWTPTSIGSAPSPRSSTAGVWTGNLMVVWGGSPYALNTGGRYDPLTDNWTPTAILGAPEGRSASFRWAGSRRTCRSIVGSSTTRPSSTAR